MNKEEINAFLQSLVLKFKYKEVSRETYKAIYKDLCSFNPTTNYFSNNIEPISLVSVQAKLSNTYDNNPNLNRVGKLNQEGNFWVIENKCGISQEELRNKLCNGIKIFIPVEAEKIYTLANKIIDFSIKENIKMKIKVAKEMRNDAITMEVATKSEVLKIEKMLNKELDYETSINPNPFLFQKGKIAFAFDGNLSYNDILSKLISSYIITKKKLQLLDTVSVEDFINYIKEEKNNLLGEQKDFYCDYYNIIDASRYNNFTKIIEIIIKNIEGKMNLENLFKYQNTKNITEEETIFNYKITEERKKRAYNIACQLEDYYGDLDLAKKNLEEFIKIGSYEIIPEDNDIRNNFMQNFTPTLFLQTIWEILIDALSDTYDKHGIRQFESAIAEMMFDNSDDLRILTNQHEKRSYLSKMLSKEQIKKILKQKAKEKDMYYTIDNIIELVSEEISSQEKQRSGRK